MVRMRTVLVIPDLKYDRNFLHSVRTAEAMGCTEIVMLKGKKKGRIFPRGSMGAWKHLKVIRFKTEQEIIDYLNTEKLKVVCIENKEDSIPLNKYNFPANVALIMGHENLGVNPQFLRYYKSVIIPQSGLVGCLNTCVAMSIVLWERYKQRLKI